MPANEPTRLFDLASGVFPKREVTVPRRQQGTQPEAAERVPLLIIVASAETALCACVKKAFIKAETVRVILDRRRHGERRREALQAGAERRSGERRDRLVIGERLRSHGWAFVYRL